VLSQPRTLLLFVEDITENPLSNWEDELKNLVAIANEQQISLYVVSRFPEPLRKALQEKQINLPEIFTLDVVAMHTAARTNPCLYLLEKGVIIDKQGYRSFDRIINRLRDKN
jgi:hypothetical protein